MLHAKHAYRSRHLSDSYMSCTFQLGQDLCTTVLQGWAVPVIQRLRGSSEGVSEFWGSLESTPVTEVVLVCEDRLGKSASVTSFLNKLMR